MKKTVYFISLLLITGFAAGVTFERDFSPLEGMVTTYEAPFRQEICLNGLWDFQPLDAGAHQPGELPALPPPVKDQWETTPIKIPSPWNVNAIGHDPTGGGMDARTFPSYPKSWETVRMGWLRKTVTVPSDWAGQHIDLHLEAVSGDCLIVVNGQEMGSHFDLYLPGTIDITDALIPGQENEILLGIRDHQFYSVSGTYGNITYPSGSFWFEAIGVWQDVYLQAKPQMHITDVFMQPMLNKDRLIADVELQNCSSKKQTIQLEIPIYEWINQTDLSKTNMMKAPEISWRLGEEEALRLSSSAITLKPRETKTVSVQTQVKGQLKTWELWTRGKPNLYAAVAELKTDGQSFDKKLQRFGWREVTIENGDFLLNGKREQLMHDGWHFTGVPIMSRRYAWGWYTLAKEAHVNFVRPHAMPYPRYFYEIADEMGMLIMDESGIFGSHCNFNYDSPEFWERNQKHITRLVKRDRNHPSIIGWSVANEIWCVLRSRAPEDYQEKIYDQINDLAKLARSLDPTRNWVQSDGDKDLGGRLNLWTIHCGGSYNDTVPDGKLWGVSEGGSSYYGKPGYYEPFVGDRAYRSFNDRMDALAKEDYNLIRTLRKQDADILNAWNLVWHGIKPIPMGLTDQTKKQLELTDGVFFRDFQEGKPGIQPERIAPYSTTVNPGYDPAYPLYAPYPLYLALQAAMHPDGAQTCEWDHFDSPDLRPKAPVIETPVQQARFIGNPAGTVYDNLQSIGIPFVETTDARTFLFIDLSSMNPTDLASIQSAMKKTVTAGGTVVLAGLNAENQDLANQLLPQPVQFTEDFASSLIPNLDDERTACLSYKELYFAENFNNRTISTGTLSGNFVEKGQTLLYRNNTDWTRWLTGNEHSKTISIYRSELENQQLPVLVEVQQGAGRIWVSALEMNVLSDAHVDLYRKLLTHSGLLLNEKKDLTVPAFNGQVLEKALVLGRFGADSLEAAAKRDFINPETIRPIEGEQTGDYFWTLAVNGGDRFMVDQLKQKGPDQIFATYFSYWIFCPIDLGDLLGAGPDLPKVFSHLYFSDACKMYLNGNELTSPTSQDVDYRTLQTYRLGLGQGWNHVLIKLVSDSYATADPGTIAVRLFSDNQAFESQLKTSIQKPE